MFAEPPTTVPRIDADAGVFVINHPPFDSRFPLETPYYRPDEVRERAEAAFGPLHWAPTGPLSARRCAPRARRCPWRRPTGTT